MIVRALLPVICTCLCAVMACTTDADRDVTISDLSVVMPTPDAKRGAAYFSLRNTSSSSITLSGVDSPDFARVEMHETIKKNDMLSMRDLPQLVVNPGESIVFAVGGKHLMLIDPLHDMQTGDRITLVFRYDSDRVLSTVAAIQSTYPSGSSE